MFNQDLSYKMKRIKLLVGQGRVTEATSFASEIFGNNSGESTFHFVMGTYFYYKDIARSIFHYETSFSSAVNSFPQSAKIHYQQAKEFVAHISMANQVYASGDYSQAHKLYIDALAVDTENNLMLNIIYFNMAQASYQLKNYINCLLELNVTLSLDRNHVKALILRARCHINMKYLDEATVDLNRAKTCTGISNETFAEINNMLDQIALMRKAKEDRNEVLNVSTSSSMQEITKAYWKLMKKHHPDRHSNATEEEKEYHAAKCKEITEAYRHLKEKMESQ